MTEETNTNNLGVHSSQFDLGLLLMITSKSLIWIVSIILLLGGLAFTYVYYTQPKYESTSIIQIINENQANRILNVGDIYEDADISKDIELLRSPEFFKRVIANLPVDVSYYVEGEVLNHERYLSSDFEVIYEIHDPIILDRRIYIEFETPTSGTINYLVGTKSFSEKFAEEDTIQTPHFSFTIVRLDEAQAQSSGLTEDRKYFILNSAPTLVQKLSKNYSVRIQSAAAKTVQIVVTDNNPAKASAICEQIAQTYLVFDHERKSESANQVLEFINQQIEEVYSKLKISEDLMSEFSQRTKLTKKKGIAATYITRVNVLEQKKVELELKISLLSELRGGIQIEKTGVDIYNLLSVLAGTEFENSVKGQIEELQNLVLTRNRLLGGAKWTIQTFESTISRFQFKRILLSRALKCFRSDLLRFKNKQQVRYNP